jgi:uncharacterized Fe-S cluster-containing radical SAM superfamily enzyme
MNFLKLNTRTKPVLINMDNVTDIISSSGVGTCIYLNCSGDEGEQSQTNVIESLEDIEEMIERRTPEH